MQNWSQHYRKLDGAPEFGQGQVWLSPELNDPWWDEFLQVTPCGQFQQSSRWAQYKAGEGWNHHRVVVTEATGIVGGFQILWKKVRFGRIGYVSKGPVAHPESATFVHGLGLLLKSATRKLGLAALVLQQPDETQVLLPLGGEIGLVQSNPLNVVEATYLVETHDEMAVLRTRMSPSLRRNLRKSHGRPGVIREGTEADLPLFFQLMTATCHRQRTAPNPASIAAIRRLWAAFSPSRSIRITIAECDGVQPAAKLSLIFGQLVTVWKKGWDGSHREWHPNELLEEESLSWAQARGYRACDFCSFNRTVAERMLSGAVIPDSALSSRDAYHLRFGGRPKLLPRSLVMLSNPVLSWVYRNSFPRLERYRERQLLAARSADH